MQAAAIERGRVKRILKASANSTGVATSIGIDTNQVFTRMLIDRIIVMSLQEYTQMMGKLLQFKKESKKV